MKKRKTFYFLATLLCLGFFASDISAQETSSIKLSYQMLESQKVNDTLTMTVKLKVRNTASGPIYNLFATNTHNENITIDTSQIEIGDIEVGKTAVSAESFIITMDVPEGEQGKPKSESVWQVDYEDSEGNFVIEEILFK